MNLDQYIGIPYLTEGRTVDGCDCWGLLRLVYRDRLGVELPSYTGYEDTLSEATGQLIMDALPEWRPVTDPQPLDGVLFNVGGRPHHIGVVVRPGWMLHTSQTTRLSCLEQYTKPMWKSRIEGFYRAC